MMRHDGKLVVATADTARSRPLRILTFLDSFEPGGVERVALRLHCAWRGLGVDSRLVMVHNGGAMRGEWPNADPEVLPDHGLPVRRFETLWLILSLPRVIRRLQPDVLFCAGNSYTVVAVLLKMIMGRRCPPVLCKISNDLRRLDLPPLTKPFYRWWLRIQGAWLDLVVGMAPAMRAELQDLMRVPRARVTIIENPSMDERDIVRFELAGRPARSGRGRRFVAVGRLAAQKNFIGLVNAFGRIARPDDRLTICGEGPERQAIETRARQLGLAAQVHLPGHTHPLDAHLLDADALVLSSDFEGVPAVVPEAFAAGLPVVATDCSVSMGDLLGHGRFGILVRPRDTAGLAAAMDRILDHPFDPALARRQARRFTVQLAAERYLAAMEGLARV